jgi:hypothetical protein
MCITLNSATTTTMTGITGSDRRTFGAHRGRGASTLDNQAKALRFPRRTSTSSSLVETLQRRRRRAGVLATPRIVLRTLRAATNLYLSRTSSSSSGPVRQGPFSDG